MSNWSWMDGATDSFGSDGIDTTEELYVLAVKSMVAGVTTVYLGGIYEFIEAGTTDKVTKY